MREVLRITAECVQIYERLKYVWGVSVPIREIRTRIHRRHSESIPFGIGRDPVTAGSAVNSLSAQLGWSGQLAQSDLMAKWTLIAGDETAKHSLPIDVTDNILTIQCDSTAWATQLRIIRVELLTRIISEFPDAKISSIQFLGPNVPSFKRGPRSIPGRGVRDTYG